MRAWTLILTILLNSPVSPAVAADWAWILSVPHAISGDQVYKVRIEEIDGEAQKELLRYAVTAGKHTIKVRMLLDVQWEPELAEAPHGPGWKELELEVTAGKTYLVAARLDPDAPIESQLDRSYWEPFVYRVD
jgi:hypothetical protein